MAGGGDVPTPQLHDILHETPQFMLAVEHNAQSCQFQVLVESFILF